MTTGPAGGLPVRGAGYEPVDTAVFSRAKCPQTSIHRLLDTRVGARRRRRSKPVPSDRESPPPPQ